MTDQKLMINKYLRSLGVDEKKSKQLVDLISYKCKQFIGPISINATAT